ncbi:MAG: DUF5325 family protein [Bacillus sp. (in: firmicutes)]
MGNKGIFLVLAILAACAMAGIGVSVGFRSVIGIIISIIALCAVMGFGFATKKKYREAGKL